MTIENLKQIFSEKFLHQYSDFVETIDDEIYWNEGDFKGDVEAKDVWQFFEQSLLAYIKEFSEDLREIRILDYKIREPLLGSTKQEHVDNIERRKYLLSKYSNE